MPAKQVRYTDQIADAICERIADGESLREICAGNNMPSKSTVFRWLAEDEKETFRDQYARAKEAQAEHMADEILHIADDGTNDWMERFDKDGNSIGWQVNGEAVQRSRIRLDARKWLLAKLQPKKYGDHATRDVNVTGNHTVNHQSADVSETAGWITDMLGAGAGQPPKDTLPN